MNLKKIKSHVINTNAQSHLCICNNYLFDDTVVNGIYGFPHSGQSRLKSFWRALASLYNIGENDLIFLYRTNGENDGCKEIHGPFKIHTINNEPSIYYDLNSKDFPILINGETDCKARFLFESFDNIVYSITDNFELIKKFESREIWGYRHPAVMNIGAARKKSITSFTNKQTLVLIDLFEKYGVQRTILKKDIPARPRIQFYNSIKQNKKQFYLNDKFLEENLSNDEAYIYCYILRAIKHPQSPYYQGVIDNFGRINSEIKSKIKFKDFSTNIQLETIITNHLQDELDLVMTDKDDKNLLFFEIKSTIIEQEAIWQAEKYLDLLKAIFPQKNIYANIVGNGFDKKIKINPKFKDSIILVNYIIGTKPFQIEFSRVNL
jgi:hypothetical protein